MWEFTAITVRGKKYIHKGFRTRNDARKAANTHKSIPFVRSVSAPIKVDA